MARIGKSVIIKGEVISSEDLIVEGYVEGRVDLQGHSLLVGTGGGIHAEIAAQTVIIQGAVTGNVTAREKIEVRETGSVDGDVVAPRIAVFDGAVLHGRVETTSAHGNRQVPVAV